MTSELQRLTLAFRGLSDEESDEEPGLESDDSYDEEDDESEDGEEGL